MMKIENLIEMLSNLAASHPKADVSFCYPSRHGGKPSTKRGKVTGYKIHLMSSPVLDHMVVFEIEHARANEIDDSNE